MYTKTEQNVMTEGVQEEIRSSPRWTSRTFLGFVALLMIEVGTSLSGHVNPTVAQISMVVTVVGYGLVNVLDTVAKRTGTPD